jgi:hypothetical protein
VVRARWPGEVQLTPFRLVVRFCEYLFDLSPDLPCLQALALATLFNESPFYEALAFAADPLSVDVDVDVDINAALYVYAQVGRGDRLPQSRCGRDGREKGEGDFDVFGRCLGAGRSQRVCEVRRGCIVRCASV